MNKKTSNRRTFLKHGALFGGSILFTGSCSQSVKAKKNLTNPVNNTLESVRSLRTIHGNFLDKEIPEESLQTILNASVRAANTTNMQNYSIVVIKNRKKMKQVSGYQGSCLLVYCADYNRTITLARHLGHSFIPDNMNRFILSSIDTILAVQTAAITARSLGIDYLITNGIHRGDMNRQWKLLDLPEKYCFPLIAMLLGYPTKEPAFKKGRLNGPGIIHYEKYHRLTKTETKKMVHQYNDPKEKLALERSKSTQSQSYLDWIFTKWMPAPNPTDEETQIFRFLKRSGFVEMKKA